MPYPEGNLFRGRRPTNPAESESSDFEYETYITEIDGEKVEIVIDDGDAFSIEQAAGWHEPDLMKREVDLPELGENNAA